MSKKIKALAVGIGLAALVAAAAALQIAAGDASAQAGPAVRAAGVGTHVTPDVTAPLTTSEAEGLAYMREEEKLAQDVYSLLADKYDARVFANIARSEAQHTETVKSFMEAFQLMDPAEGRDAGVYENDELQALYRQLVDQGSRSWAGAVDVGIAIEKQDIADLQARIAATDRADLKAMYENLLRASENHLNAFTRQLDGTLGSTGSYGAGAGSGQGAGMGHGAGTGRCVD